MRAQVLHVRRNVENRSRRPPRRPDRAPPHFPQPGEQAKAIGIYGFIASGGGSIGLLAGGVLTDAINWHWIFFLNVPIGLITALLAFRLVQPHQGLGLKAEADVQGALLVTAGLMLAYLVGAGFVLASLLVAVFVIESPEAHEYGVDLVTDENEPSAKPAFELSS